MHHIGSASLFFTPDMIDVLGHLLFVEAVGLADIAAGILVIIARFERHSPFGLCQQFLAGTKKCRTGWAGFRTSGHQAVINALNPWLIAHLTLADVAKYVAIFKLRHVVGAGYHAVSAANTTIRMVGYYAGTIVPAH